MSDFGLSFGVWLVFTQRVAQKGQPFWTSREGVAAPSIPASRCERSLARELRGMELREDGLSKALFPSPSPAQQEKGVRLLLNQGWG